ncbi:hypothetical protein [Anabaena azotica]|uniref:Uncharacterized protein n=1 Tax=Anabaena azotica FACHB-119 TaxID=947527 RepID=A0ABR8D0G1_9NOST|nr:hypothetical protein [Anabaena azotica]MBD2500669.1 hypothetical protein [Anabaena azotica FACHB-119]
MTRRILQSGEPRSTHQADEVRDFQKINYAIYLPQSNCLSPCPLAITVIVYFFNWKSLGRLLSIKEIYYEQAALNYTRVQEILAQHSDAKLFEVDSHWNIPKLHGNAESVQDWNRIKRTVLVLRVKKSLQCRPKTLTPCLNRKLRCVSPGRL